MARKIVCTPDTCTGSPRIEGTRLICANITMDMYYNYSIHSFLDIYDYLTENDIRVCLQYCSNQRCLDDKPLHFCQGCTLDKRPEERPSHFLNAPGKLDEYIRNPSIKGHAYLGTEEEYERDGIPENLWELAKECLKDLSCCPIVDQPK